MRRWLSWVMAMAMAGSAAADGTVTVYAAASLTSALQELAPLAQQRGMPLRLAFGSSSTMAKQIAQGAPADVFLSADEQWMDFLGGKDLIEADTRVNLLRNSLVVIAPKGEGIRVEPRADFDFAGAFEGRLALGDPSHVPAGIYARQALEHLGWWHSVKDRVAPAMDVRGALALVERGECPVGIVYATDAAVSSGVAVVVALPDSLHKPIVYPMATVKGRRTPGVDAAMRFLQSDAALAVFRKYGFRTAAH